MRAVDLARHRHRMHLECVRIAAVQSNSCEAAIMLGAYAIDVPGLSDHRCTKSRYDMAGALPAEASAGVPSASGASLLDHSLAHGRGAFLVSPPVPRCNIQPDRRGEIEYLSDQARRRRDDSSSHAG